MDETKRALEAKDWDGMLQAAHTLKGVAGNLGLDPIYCASSNIVEALRAQDVDAAKEIYRELGAAYETTCSVIRATAEER